MKKVDQLRDVGAEAEFDHPVNGDQEGDAFGNALRWIWRQRVIVFGSFLLGLLFAVALTLGFRLLQQENVTEYVIEFRFEGRNENRYPNGSPFALSDIVAPGILSSVYQSEKLAEAGVSLQEFQSSIYVTPYSPDRRLILARYDKIDERRATVAELSEAQSSLERELSSASSRYAALRYSDQGFGLPQSKVQTLLEKIASEWERVAIETRGVLGVDIAPLPSNVFADAGYTGLEKLNAIKVIRDNVGTLRDFVEKITAKPGGNTLRDPETGSTAITLRAMLERSILQLAEIPAPWTASPSEAGANALGTPLALYSQRLFEETDLQELDYLIALDLLRQRSALIRDNVARIEARDFGVAAKDPKTNLSARDIDRLLTDLEDYTLKQLTAPVLSLGIAKNPDVVNLYYRSRLDELRREKETLVSKAKVLESANQNYQGLAASGNGIAPGPGTNGAFPPATSTVIPQFGDAFLDRIIELTQKGGDTQFRQKLLEETVTLQQRGADTDEQIKWIEEYIDRFGNPDQSAIANPGDPAQREYFVGLLNKQIPEVLAKYKEYAEITQRIAERLRFAEDIHSIIMPAGAQGLALDFYLRDVAASPMTIENILKQLRGYTDIANRLYEQLSVQTLGRYEHLYSAASNALQIRRPLVSQFELLFIGLTALLAPILALGVAFLAQTVRRRA